jgi:hypothetical protein
VLRAYGDRQGGSQFTFIARHGDGHLKRPFCPIGGISPTHQNQLRTLGFLQRARYQATRNGISQG